MYSSCMMNDPRASLFEAPTARHHQFDVLWEQLRDTILKLEIQLDTNVKLECLLKESEADKKSLKEAIDAKNDFIQTIQKDFDAMVLESQASKTMHEALTSSIKDLKKSLAYYTNKLEEDEKSYEKKLEFQDETINAKINEIEVLHKATKDYEEQILELKMANSRLNCDNKNLSDKFEDAQATCLTHVVKIEEQTKALEAVEQECACMNRKLSETALVISELKEQQTEQKVRNAEMTQEVSKLKSDFVAALATKGSELEGIKKENAAICERLNKQIERADECAAEVWSWRDSVSVLETKLDEEKMHYKAYEAEMNLKYSALLAEKSSLKEEMKLQRQFLSELEDKFIDAETVIREKDQQLSILKESQRVETTEPTSICAFSTILGADFSNSTFTQPITAPEDALVKAALKDEEESQLEALNTEALEEIEDAKTLNSTLASPTNFPDAQNLVAAFSFNSLIADTVDGGATKECNINESEVCVENEASLGDVLGIEEATSVQTLMPLTPSLLHRYERRLHSNNFLERQFCLACNPFLHNGTTKRRKRNMEGLKGLSNVVTPNDHVEGNCEIKTAHEYHQHSCFPIDNSDYESGIVSEGAPLLFPYTNGSQTPPSSSLNVGNTNAVTPLKVECSDSPATLSTKVTMKKLKHTRLSRKLITTYRVRDKRLRRSSRLQHVEAPQLHHISSISLPTLGNSKGASSQKYKGTTKKAKGKRNL